MQWINNPLKKAKLISKPEMPPIKSAKKNFKFIHSENDSDLPDLNLELTDGRTSKQYFTEIQQLLARESQYKEEKMDSFLELENLLYGNIDQEIKSILITKYKQIYFDYIDKLLVPPLTDKIQLVANKLIIIISRMAKNYKKTEYVDKYISWHIQLLILATKDRYSSRYPENLIDTIVNTLNELITKHPHEKYIKQLLTCIDNLITTSLKARLRYNENLFINILKIIEKLINIYKSPKINKKCFGRIKIIINHKYYYLMPKAK